MATSDLPPEALLAQGAYLRRLARALVLDESSADDLVQEAYVAALRRPPRDPGRLRAWLSVVVRNAAYKARRGTTRRRQREERVARPQTVRSTADQAAREETTRAVLEAVLRLDTPQRTVLWKRFYEDQPPRAIAAELGISVNTVKSRIRLAIGRLRADLDGPRHGLRSDWRVTLAAVGGIVVGTKPKLGWIAGLVALLLAASVGIVAFEVVRSRGDESPTEHALTPTDSIAAAPEAPELRGKEPDAPAPTTTPGRADATTVTGRIVGPDGLPVPEAAIRSFDAQLTGGTQAADENGRFAFAVLRPLPFGLVAVAPGYASRVGPRFAWRPGEVLEAGTFRLEPGFRIEGRVVDAAGRPVESASLQIEMDADPVPESWKPRKWLTVGTQPKHTDEEGRFAFTEVPAGRYRIKLYALEEGGYDQVREEVAAGSKDVTFVVSAAPERIDVRLRLQVEGPDGTVVPHCRTCLSGSEGACTLTWSPADNHPLELGDMPAPVRLLVWDARDENDAALGYAPVLLVGVRSEPRPLVIRMAPGPIVRGRVVGCERPGALRLRAESFGAEDGTWVASGIHDENVRVTALAVTEEDGSFLLHGLPTGRTRITLADEADGTVRLRDGGLIVDVPTEDVRLEAYTSRALSLLVTAPEGLKVEWTKIRVDRWTPRGLKTSWVSSEYDRPPPAAEHPVLVPGLEPDGRYRLTLHAVCSGRQCRTVVLDVVAPQPEPRVVQLSAAPRITGRVVRPDGSPVADARVFFRAWPGGRFLPDRFHGIGLCPISGYTGADGRFVIEVPPDVDILLALDARGLATTQDPPRTRGGASDVTVVAHPARAISGRVSDPAGGRLHDLLVAAVPAEGTPCLWEPHRVAADGSFRVPRLGPGRWRIALWNDDDGGDSRCALSDPVEVGSVDVPLVLRRGASIEARILDAGELAATGARVLVRGLGVHRWGTADHAGRVAFRGLPPGSYELLVNTADGRQATSPATAHMPGRVAPLSVHLDPR